MSLCLYRPRQRPQVYWLSTTIVLTVMVAGVIEFFARISHPVDENGLPAIKFSKSITLFHSAAQSGDLIFRRGRSLISRAVLSADGHSEFSHVGIVFASNRAVWVIHAKPPENGALGGVVSEPLDVFLGVSEASAAALYRPNNSRAADLAASFALGYAHTHVPFDSDFDLSTSREMYCTEMVWRAYRRAGLDLVTPKHDEKYLLPSKIQRSPHLHLVKEIREEESGQ